MDKEAIPQAATAASAAHQRYRSHLAGVAGDGFDVARHRLNVADVSRAERDLARACAAAVNADIGAEYEAVVIVSRRPARSA